jgi:hypothetical protein
MGALRCQRFRTDARQDSTALHHCITTPTPAHITIRKVRAFANPAERWGRLTSKARLEGDGHPAHLLRWRRDQQGRVRLRLRCREPAEPHHRLRRIPRSDSDIRTKYLAPKDKLNVARARTSVRAARENEAAFTTCMYRPFDSRALFSCDAVPERSRRETMHHVLAGNTSGVHLCRQIVSDGWCHVRATDKVTDDCYVSNKTRERGYTFPPLSLSVRRSWDRHQTEFDRARARVGCGWAAATPRPRVHRGSRAPPRSQSNSPPLCDKHEIGAHHSCNVC